jgi:hypothetical protein
MGRQLLAGDDYSATVVNEGAVEGAPYLIVSRCAAHLATFMQGFPDAVKTRVVYPKDIPLGL